MTHEELVACAREAQSFAYAPYSGFPVGAALLCADGSVYTGCNVENAAFGAALCAERVALGKAVSEGKRAFRALAVIAKGNAFCTPCGTCRQVLWEFSKDLLVLCANERGNFAAYPLAELLPHGFGGEHLTHQ